MRYYTVLAAALAATLLTTGSGYAAQAAGRGAAAASVSSAGPSTHAAAGHVQISAGWGNPPLDVVPDSRPA